MNFSSPVPVPEDPKPRKVPLAERWHGFPLGMVVTIVVGVICLTCMGALILLYVPKGDNLMVPLLLGAMVTFYLFGVFVGSRVIEWRVGDEWEW